MPGMWELGLGIPGDEETVGLCAPALGRPPGGILGAKGNVKGSESDCDGAGAFGK